VRRIVSLYGNDGWLHVPFRRDLTDSSRRVVEIEADMARNILIIDRDRLVRETIKVILDFEGHEAVPFHDGRDGIKAFRAKHFDLVICDIFMPNRSGLEVISEIRRLSATAPIIAMTAGFAKAPEARFRSDLGRIVRHNGATLTLAKPFRRDEFVALLDRCFAKVAVHDLARDGLDQMQRETAAGDSLSYIGQPGLTQCGPRSLSTLGLAESSWRTPASDASGVQSTLPSP
jgi:two-component system, chemotaxis family, chemotaxis protein CheY